MLPATEAGFILITENKRTSASPTSRDSLGGPIVCQMESINFE
jgi:hypothetical protein